MRQTLRKFKISFQYIQAKIYWNLILKASNTSHLVPIGSKLRPNLPHWWQGTNGIPVPGLKTRRLKYAHPVMKSNISQNSLKNNIVNSLLHTELYPHHCTLYTLHTGQNLISHTVTHRDIKFDIPIGSDWPQMGQIFGFLRSVSVHFGSVSQNVLKLILKCPR